jgi:high affinity Mn2+ porin
LSQGAELWIDPAIDQGFGLANTEGVAGFAGGTALYFVRQTIDLGGETQKVAADLNQFAVFDKNKYTQNARQDFLNWALIDAGSFDYASDARGYTYGASLEWYASVDAVVAGERIVADFDIEILHSVRAASRRTTEAP